MAVDPATARSPDRIVHTLAVITVGMLTAAVSLSTWSRRYGRPFAAISVWLVVALPIAASLLFGSGGQGEDSYIPAAITFVMLTAVAVVPFTLRHTLVLGLAIESVYIFSTWLAGRWGVPLVPGSWHAHLVYAVVLTVLACGIAAGNYRHRQSEHASQRQAVRVAEALTGAQLRAQLAENAISIGKMAAALSHEINSPLGALRSSVETLLTVTDRQMSASAAEGEQLARMRADLVRSIHECTSRIEEVTTRLRRFVNLEEAEMKSADINELLTDVTLLHEEQIANRIQLEMNLQPLPRLTCRPQLLTAAFSSLLSNAINAVNGNGRIAISTRQLDEDVEVTIQDNGKGMSAQEVENLFDPSFKVSGSRVASGNWTLFNSRQIFYEHGGDIQVESAEGLGTTMHIKLPYVAPDTSPPA
jgi:signal transduction histidine kinase